MKPRMLMVGPLLVVALFGGACGEGSIDGDARIDGPSVDARDSINPAGRGPTGQWPPGFPSYTTAADVTTDGSMGSLQSALNGGTCSAGCVIEHAGTVSGTITRGGSGEIVVRPPIGERADFALSGPAFEANDIVLAGYSGDSSLIWRTSSNAGVAWIEAEQGGTIYLDGNSGKSANGFIYELMHRQFGSAGLNDRIIGRTTGGGVTNLTVVGSVITGDPGPPGEHADTVQFYHQGGSGRAVFYDTVIWPSWDKVFQGQNDLGLYDCFNCWTASPSEANRLWPGGSLGFSQGVHTTAVVEYRNSTINGEGHPGHVIKVWDSEVFGFTNYTEMGGNTTRGAPIDPPPIPTHEQLDAIWSP